MSRIIIFILTLPCFYYYVNCHNHTICTSKNIKNNVTKLNILKNCTEIAGSLEIVLLENIEDPSEFDGYVFPNLKIISGYLLLYNVHHLTSIGQLFPNLYLIRGKKLFRDYSLIVHNMPHIKQIGTTNLLLISGGSVRIEKNPELCFVNTINWQKLGVNRPDIWMDQECGRCPSECQGFCWNSTHCQELIEQDCHKECMGCYKKNSPRDCKVCRHYEDDGVCVSSCPSHKFTHTMIDKCVTKEECETLLPDHPWWVDKKQCVSECPEFMVLVKKPKPNSAKLEYTCQFCGENCTKHCNLTDEIDAMSPLQKLKGCTHINGSLIIKMSNMEPSDLFKYLGTIRNISGMLMIAHTNRLSSLDFLRNVTYIGTDTRNEMEMYANYSIFMYENQNLQELWNNSNRNFTLKGTIGFHNNPLLCVSKIEELATATNVTYTDQDVSRFSNGDKASCLIKQFEVNAAPNSTNVTITWYPPKLENYQTYIGYTVFYKKGDKGNTTAMDSKDVCVTNEWNSIFTTNNTIDLVNLFPNTSYAYYIKMYTSSNSSTQDSFTQGFQGTMSYFNTASDDPDDFEYLTITPIDHQSVMLNWKKPALPNGQLAHYVLDFNQLDDELIYERDYCKYPRTEAGKKIDEEDTSQKDLMKIDSKTFNKTSLDKLDDNCTCPSAKPKSNSIASTTEYTFVSKDEQLDVCRTIAKWGMPKCQNLEYDPANKFNKRENNRQLISANLTSFNITNLNPFTLYVIYFSACNEPVEEKRCSGVLQRFARTLKKPNSDNIKDVKIEPLGEGSIKISWTPPSRPNSNIVAYKITLASSDSFVFHSECIRVRSRERNKRSFSYVYSYLKPGEYNVSVRAESLAGLSDQGRSQLFEVKSPGNKQLVIVGVTVACFACMVTVGAYLYFKKFRKFNREPILFSSVNPEYVGPLYVQDEWEIDREDITFIRGLGQGTFGTVFQGLIKSRGDFPCAIKTVNENLSLHEKMKFLNEASVMKAFSDCYHVVKLLGVVSTSNPPLVIMELMERGDLKTCLRKTRDSSHDLTSNEIYRMAVEIADGMAYLSAKKFVHRDLAARNCMVASDRTVKVGDFGMARDIYETDYYRKETKGLLPVRWMAPESLADGVFTTDSDVWSFGIVLWEIATLAEQPYQGLSNEQVLQFVISRGRLTRPQECSDLLYEVMRKCWSWRPCDRPSFWDITELLEDRVSEDFKLVAFVHSREASLFSRQRAENPPALSVEPRDDLLCHYNADDDEVSLHVGGVPRRPSYLQTSLNQRRFSPTDDFY